MKEPTDDTSKECLFTLD